jgi:outer membrane receptor for ferrienterochelin and colicin
MIFCLFVVKTQAQAPMLTGNIFELTPEGKKQALPGANVFWKSTSDGTISDGEGKFSLISNQKSKILIVSYVGFATDTITIDDLSKPIEIVLKNNAELNEVLISERKQGSYLSANIESLTTVVSSEGLKKLPCCNLSESFENNAAVDVVFTDAVSGAKQIQMLGLSGIYSQMLNENRPSVRGLSVPFGLSFVPGAWLESIQISKGAASVINGFESMSGQINYELKKPNTSEKLFANLYGNSEGRGELNLNSAYQFSEHWSTMILAHTSANPIENDMNHDGFMDLPTGKQINFANRWKYDNHQLLETQFGINYLSDSRTGGQISNSDHENSVFGRYTTGIETNRIEGFGKLGFVIPNSDASIGSMFSYSAHEQNSHFGNNSYNASQNSFYGNIIFDTHISGENHKLNAGISFISDVYKQNLNDSVLDFSENVPGVFVQYNYKYAEKLSVIAGIRSDFSSREGLFISPRLHMKFNPAEHTTFRISGGKGYRTAVPVAENISVLASSRKILLSNSSTFESAWNYGASLSQDFEFNNKKSIKITIDYFRTDFTNQVIVNLDKASNVVIFENLNGKSFSNSYQIEIATTPIKFLEINAALRYNDVQLTLNDELQRKPLTPDWKGLLTLSYRTKFSKWQFDITNQFTGKSRIPNTADKPEALQLPEYSKPFYILHLQITRRFKKIDFYAGAENATNYVQKNPILASDDPFGPNFDGSIIWAPLTGRMFFGGLRYTFK